MIFIVFIIKINCINYNATENASTWVIYLNFGSTVFQKLTITAEYNENVLKNKNCIPQSLYHKENRFTSKRNK